MYVDRLVHPYRRMVYMYIRVCALRTISPAVYSRASTASMSPVPGSMAPVPKLMMPPPRPSKRVYSEKQIEQEEQTKKCKQPSVCTASKTLAVKHEITEVDKTKQPLLRLGHFKSNVIPQSPPPKTASSEPSAPAKPAVAPPKPSPTTKACVPTPVRSTTLPPPSKPSPIAKAPQTAPQTILKTETSLQAKAAALRLTKGRPSCKQESTHEAPDAAQPGEPTPPVVKTSLAEASEASPGESSPAAASEASPAEASRAEASGSEAAEPETAGANVQKAKTAVKPAAATAPATTASQPEQRPKVHFSDAVTVVNAPEVSPDMLAMYVVSAHGMTVIVPDLKIEY